ncbi:lysosomal-associated transmembrane protein 4B isoform X1 [Archocentrus centrarchus]|uniref:lysosomal-associated transmembrane protein 4B isoform X1 n=1 Tax=Archocentrus centrarchus TaxID=63155 RepID=UPI0011E9BCEB|nr:lysosomal-associated transmembrane protein 4B isoform X1 [Archocentrus centrarchus]
MLADTQKMMMATSPWDRWYSTRCCLCCHVRTGTIILGVWYMLINAVVLLILLTALSDPEQYHLTSAELANDLDVMDDANMCIASAISLLMILICGMATYGAYKLRPAWIIPFFCYQIFDFALNTLVAVSIVVYPNTIQDYLQQLPDNFPYKEEVAALSNVCLVLIVLLFIGCILGFKAYLFINIFIFCRNAKKNKKRNLWLTLMSEELSHVLCFVLSKLVIRVGLPSFVTFSLMGCTLWTLV